MGAYSGPTNSWIGLSTTNSLNGIVTSGLVLALDAARTLSYAGIGTTWRDLSSNGNTGTLTNGPSYSSANLGSIVFDGTNDFVNFTSDSNLLPTVGITVSVWTKTTVADRWLVVKTTSLLTSGYAMIGNGAGNMQFTVSGVSATTPDVITTGQWLNLVGTWTPSTSIKIYQNGTLVNTNTTSVPVSIGSTTVILEVGRNFTNGTTGTDYWNGNISQVLIYNRALTDAEILQNYNAINGRYDL